MTPQDVIWTIALAGMGLVTIAFIHVTLQAGIAADAKASNKALHTAHVLRRWLFAVLLIGFAVGTWATLNRFPIPPQRNDLGAQQVVQVVGRLWAWQIEPETVQAGSAVEFRVTSADVNHGFAIYAPDGRIVIQTQAMPGYTNKLVHTFDQPGTYTIQCLEFCGVGHAPMTSQINVVAAKGN